jgi:hypothetical protein
LRQELSRKERKDYPEELVLKKLKLQGKNEVVVGKK